MRLHDTRISGLPWAATTSRLRDEQVAVYAVAYPATRDFLKAVDEATDARARVEATAGSCPSTEIVLGGYSQGAPVIDLITGPEGGAFGFVRPLPADIANHVLADRAAEFVGDRLQPTNGPT
jgi:cutinase-like protein